MSIDRLRLYLAVKGMLALRCMHEQVAVAVRGQHFEDDSTLVLNAEEYERREPMMWTELQAAFDGCESPLPIDMVLHCPACHLQHIDHDFPPHCSHLCCGCGFIWRPADVPTNGVRAVRTKGRNDS